MLTVEQLNYVIVAQYFGILLPGAGSRWKSSVGGRGPSAISRSGSPGGSDIAEHSIRTASTLRLIWAVGKPASSISGATGADRGQSVIALALLGARSP